MTTTAQKVLPVPAVTRLKLELAQWESITGEDTQKVPIKSPPYRTGSIPSLRNSHQQRGQKAWRQTEGVSSWCWNSWTCSNNENTRLLLGVYLSTREGISYQPPIPDSEANCRQCIMAPGMDICIRCKNRQERGIMISIGHIGCTNAKLNQFKQYFVPGTPFFKKRVYLNLLQPADETRCAEKSLPSWSNYPVREFSNLQLS